MKLVESDGTPVVVDVLRSIVFTRPALHLQDILQLLGLVLHLGVPRVQLELAAGAVDWVSRLVEGDVAVGHDSPFLAGLAFHRHCGGARKSAVEHSNDRVDVDVDVVLEIGHLCFSLILLDYLALHELSLPFFKVGSRLRSVGTVAVERHTSVSVCGDDDIPCSVLDDPVWLSHDTHGVVQCTGESYVRHVSDVILLNMSEVECVHELPPRRDTKIQSTFFRSRGTCGVLRSPGP